MTDFTAEHTATDEFGWITAIEKIGGGTFGRAYAGRWAYKVFDDQNNLVEEGDDFWCGTPRTHRKVAIDIGDWVHDKVMGEL